MSTKVDLSIFDEMFNDPNVTWDRKEENMEDNNIDTFIYSICESEIGLSDSCEGCPSYPVIGDRGWKDPSYQQERDVYQERVNQLHETLISDKYDFGWVWQEGGGEGGAEFCSAVFRFTGKFYKAFYNYYSSTGYDYCGIANSLVEVKPVEKTVTVYE